MRHGVNTFLDFKRTLCGSFQIIIAALHINSCVTLFLITKPVGYLYRCSRQVINLTLLNIKFRIVKLGQIIVRWRTLIDWIPIYYFLIISTAIIDCFWISQLHYFV